MFIIIGNDLKDAIRKDKDFIASKQGEISYTCQFTTIYYYYYLVNLYQWKLSI